MILLQAPFTTGTFFLDEDGNHCQILVESYHAGTGDALVTYRQFWPFNEKVWSRCAGEMAALNLVVKSLEELEQLQRQASAAQARSQRMLKTAKQQVCLACIQ